MKNWRQSDYPFKSPHWRKYTGKIFNHLCQIEGDPSKVPVYVPKDENIYEYREQAKYKAISEKSVEMMENFFKLSDYTDLASIEQTIPFRYLYILPARQGIVIYSAYSHLISTDPNQIASYAEMQAYIGCGPDEIDSYREQYYIFGLLRDYFHLFTISKPFRCLLGLPAIISPKRSNYNERLNDNLELMKKRAAKIMNYIEPISEWKRVCSPSEILKTIYRILTEHGSRIALQYVRYIFRLESLFRQKLIVEEEFNPQVCAKKFAGLTERYLNINEVIKAVDRIDR